jgi:hypothetical protein
MHQYTIRAGFVLAFCCALTACEDSGGGDGGTGGAGAITGGVSGMAGMAGMGTGGVAGMGTGGAAGMGTGGAAGMGATGAPTWSAVYSEIIVAKGCSGGALCHLGTVGGGLMMSDAASAYAALVGVPAMGMNLLPDSTDPECKDSGLTRVVAGDPDMSLLVQKIEGTQTCGTAMPPPPGTLLGVAEVAQVRMWIQNGAHED